MLTCVDHADRVTEAAHPCIKLDIQARPTRWVTPPHKSLVGYGQPAHAGTYRTAPSRFTHTPLPGFGTEWNSRKWTAPPGGGQPAGALPRARQARSNTLLISWESEQNEEQHGRQFSHTSSGAGERKTENI